MKKYVNKKIIQNKSLRQIIKFGTVGFSGTIIDLGIYNLFGIVFGINIYLARTISFILAASSNYCLNRIWTFRSQEEKVVRQYGQFFIVSAIGLGLNLLIMRFLQGFVAKIENEILRKNIPVLFAIFIVLIWNYLANKFWTFKDTLKKS